jgi:catabolite regulation protein CreA
MLSDVHIIFWSTCTENDEGKAQQIAMIQTARMVLKVVIRVDNLNDPKVA